MFVPLTRAYTCRMGAPTVDHVDPRIFTLTYFGLCMDCTFCHDACCQYGADTELPRVAALEQHQAELEAYLGVPRSRWFREDPADFGVMDDADYPSGQYTRTAVVPLPDGRSPHVKESCVFLDPAGRGCRIHRFALERNIPVTDIKPMICVLFPVSFAERGLIPAYEFDCEGELVCEGPGPTLYQSARPDVLNYFGPELVAELDVMERAHRPVSPSGGVSLPVCTS